MKDIPEFGRPDDDSIRREVIASGRPAVLRGLVADWPAASSTTSCFPPEQVGNLYAGPLDFAPTGAPVSLARLDAPDFERFPRFRAALTASWARGTRSTFRRCGGITSSRSIPSTC